jgi:hypothetical protein
MGLFEFALAEQLVPVEPVRKEDVGTICRDLVLPIACTDVSKLMRELASLLGGNSNANLFARGSSLRPPTFSPLPPAPIVDDLGQLGKMQSLARSNDLLRTEIGDGEDRDAFFRERLETLVRSSRRIAIIDPWALQERNIPSTQWFVNECRKLIIGPVPKEVVVIVTAKPMADVNGARVIRKQRHAFHDRHILFDDKFAICLGSGLSTFNNQCADRPQCSFQFYSWARRSDLPTISRLAGYLT